MKSSSGSAADASGRTSFRRLTEPDIPLLHRWLNAPHVLEWWDRPGPALGGVREKYLPRVTGASDVTPYIICRDGVPIGYIQVYPVEAGAWGLADVRGGAGVDLFIGDARYLHRGFGPEILREFVGEIVFRDGAVASCFIDPSPRNRIAIRAFEKAGFRGLAAAVDPKTGQAIEIMELTRAAFEQGSRS
jgi:RimJ/RimL family protein N-acetyltransferase